MLAGRVFWLFLIACGPKQPPEGSVSVDREVPAAPIPMPTVAGNPMPYGAALPFEVASTEAEKSLVEGEEVVLGMDRWPAATDPASSKKRALDLVASSERAIELFRLAAQQDDLADIAACRTADALRLASLGILETQDPVPGADASAALREAAQPLIDQARTAYTSVLNSPDARWSGHAKWGLGELEEL